MNRLNASELDLLRKIKSVTFCTVENGYPKARIADVMFVEDQKIYFTTARGKSFYRQLINNPNVAIVGMEKKYKTERIKGRIRKEDRHIVDKIFELNPMMNELYEGEKRDILEAFCVYEGVGEIFDLGTIPIKRTRFSFGGMDVIDLGFKINEQCISCGICLDACPEKCISNDAGYKIDKKQCIECGRCYESCRFSAIDKPMRF